MQLQIGVNTIPITATVESVAPVMDAKSGTVEVTVAIDNPNEQISSGARCWLLMSGDAAGTSEPTRYTSAARREQP